MLMRFKNKIINTDFLINANVYVADDNTKGEIHFNLMTGGASSKTYSDGYITEIVTYPTWDDAMREFKRLVE